MQAGIDKIIIKNVKTEEISELSVQNGLPKCYGNVRLSAEMALEIGIPKDFP